MIVVGLSGNYACGKTFVLNYINSLGYKTFSADEVIRNLYKQEAIRNEVLRLIPLLKDFDKEKIAFIIYNDPKWRKILEDFIHPLVLKELIEFKNNNKNEGIIFAEVPLLFELNWDKYFNYTVAVCCSEESRLARAKLRKDFKPAIYEKITNIQLPPAIKVKRADFLIDTNNKLTKLKEEINNLIKNLK